MMSRNVVTFAMQSSKRPTSKDVQVIANYTHHAHAHQKALTYNNNHNNLCTAQGSDSCVFTYAKILHVSLEGLDLFQAALHLRLPMRTIFGFHSRTDIVLFPGPINLRLKNTYARNLGSQYRNVFAFSGCLFNVFAYAEKLLYSVQKGICPAPASCSSAFSYANKSWTSFQTDHCLVSGSYLFAFNSTKMCLSAYM